MTSVRRYAIDDAVNYNVLDTDSTIEPSNQFLYVLIICPTIDRGNCETLNRITLVHILTVR